MNEAPGLALGSEPLPEPLRARIEAELAPGEQLLWASRPDPSRPRGPRRSKGSTWVWLAGWVTLGLLSLLIMMALAGTRFESFNGFLMLVLTVAGVTSILMATHLIAGYVKDGSWRRRAGVEMYALTDRRALIWTPAERSTAVLVQQHLPGTIRPDQIERIEYPDGLGNLTWKPGSYQSGQDGFFGVAEIRRVDELVRRVLLKPVPAQTLHDTFDPDDPEEPF